LDRPVAGPVQTAVRFYRPNCAQNELLCETKFSENPSGVNPVHELAKFAKFDPPS
jgi:hypothetical protein